MHCDQHIPQCELTPVLHSRFKSLKNSQNWLIALNLYNSEHIMNNLIQELQTVIQFLGVNRSMVSIYESGSYDNSRPLLTMFARQLEAAGIPNYVSTSVESINWDKEFRIEALAQVRNKALKPLYMDVESVSVNRTIAKFQKLIFLNDVFFCAADVLELVLQQSNSGATMACPLDLEAYPTWQSFYDLWVARTMSGDILYNAFHDYKDGAANTSLSKQERWTLRSKYWDRKGGLDLFWKDPIGKLRASKGLPVQVYSCWNGGIAMDTRPFYDYNLKFRTAYPKECKESECTLFSKDLWNSGYGKIVIVPNIIVSYEREKFLYFRTKWESLISPSEIVKPMYSDLLSVNTSLVVSNEIDWQPIPSLVRCFELPSRGARYINWIDMQMIDPSVDYRDFYE